jgi:hypothetical protein
LPPVIAFADVDGLVVHGAKTNRHSGAGAAPGCE